VLRSNTLSSPLAIVLIRVMAKIAQDVTLIVGDFIYGLP
jgi:hypothetical protein